METSISTKRRMAQNTAFLYLRMLVVMGVTFYTSRVVLSALGESDYGIYGVVGGVVTMFSFISGSFSASTSRFLTYELGKGDKVVLGRTFSAALNLHILAALLVILVGETVGVWFLYEKMTIPESRMNAAFWVLQFSIITTCCNFMQIPFRASIISRENMAIFAYVGLYEAFSQLIIAFLIQIEYGDRLILYGLFLMINVFLVQSFYCFYTYRKYKECRFGLVADKTLYIKLFWYSGWNMFGHVASLSQGQGINIVLNLFYGPAVNAARTIAVMIQSGLQTFVINFLTAVRPRVVKLYAENNYALMYKLTFLACKISYFLMFALVFPLAFEMDFVFRVWLGNEIPPYTNIFAWIILGIVLTESFHSAFLMAFHAIGRMKLGNLLCGSLMILALPIGYIALKIGFPPYSVFIIILVTNIVCHIISWMIVHSYVPFSFRHLVLIVYLPCLLVTMCALPIPLLIMRNLEEGWLRFFVLLTVSELLYGLSIYFIGFNRMERQELVIPVLVKIKKK